MKKGFTLIEVIIVITIIAILSTVLFPTISSFINKAKKSNDMIKLNHINDLLTNFELESNFKLDHHLAFEIINADNSLNLVSESKSMFWFNCLTRRIVLKELNIDQLNIENHNYLDIGNIENNNLILIDQSNKLIPATINQLRNLNNSEKAANAFLRIIKVLPANFKTYFNLFNPTNTAYISNEQFMVSESINKIVFNLGTNFIQAANLDFALCNNIVLPKSVKVVFKGAFSSNNLVDVKINYCKNTRFEKGSTNSSLKKLNKITEIELNYNYNPLNVTELDVHSFINKDEKITRYSLINYKKFCKELYNKEQKHLYQYIDYTQPISFFMLNKNLSFEETKIKKIISFDGKENITYTYFFNRVHYLVDSYISFCLPEEVKLIGNIKIIIHYRGSRTTTEVTNYRILLTPGSDPFFFTIEINDLIYYQEYFNF